MARKNRHRPWPLARNAAIRQAKAPVDWRAEARRRLAAGQRRRQEGGAKT